MSEPILKNVKRGQMFRTADNQIAIILQSDHEDAHWFDGYVSNGQLVNYDINGCVDSRFHSADYNLMERYFEEIDEEALEKKARAIANELVFEPTGWIPELKRPELSLNDLIDAVKKGYYLRNNE